MKYFKILLALYSKFAAFLLSDCLQSWTKWLAMRQQIVPWEWKGRRAALLFPGQKRGKKRMCYPSHPGTGHPWTFGYSTMSLLRCIHTLLLQSLLRATLVKSSLSSPFKLAMSIIMAKSRFCLTLPLWGSIIFCFVLTMEEHKHFQILGLYT